MTDTIRLAGIAYMFDAWAVTIEVDNSVYYHIPCTYDFADTGESFGIPYLILNEVYLDEIRINFIKY